MARSSPTESGATTGSEQLRRNYVRIAELLSQLDREGPPRDEAAAATWVAEASAALKAARKIAERSPSRMLRQKLEVHETLVNLRIAELTSPRQVAMAPAKGRWGLSIASAAASTERDPLARLRELYAVLDDMLRRAAAGEVPRSGSVKGEWVTSAQSALAAARRLTRQAQESSLAGQWDSYRSRVEVMIAALSKQGGTLPKNLESPIDSRTSNARRAKRQVGAKVKKKQPDRLDGVWQVVRGVEHRVRAGSLMYCGAVARVGKVARAVEVRRCRACVARTEEAQRLTLEREEKNAKRPKRRWSPRYWEVSGGAPGLGKRR